MSDIIHLLPDSVANQIAAGEVIQRPASVVKELVENAVDAGATKIDVYVVDAGRTTIQVVDNGKGMSDTDARLAFERHATSKIRCADDLYTLATMGFRGEALPSIVAVAMVEMRTRRAEDELGTQLSLAASKVIEQKLCACPVGCNIKVENIFFNVPARRKFLKSNATELNNIITAFERIALVYPAIEFTFHSNDSELLALSAGNIAQRIAALFGKRLSQSLLPVEARTDLCTIYGFVGTPESARKKCSTQYFFVNGRYMKHTYFSKAVLAAYERLVPAGDQVPYFIYFEVDAATIDVNIHPSKTEIKFENEQPIWQILSAAVREAVGVFSEMPTFDFDSTPPPDMPVITDTPPAAVPVSPTNENYNPFLRNEHVSIRHSPTQEEVRAVATPHEERLFAPDEGLATPDSAFCYQYKGQYIITTIATGLLIIDQHRAHVRVLYERYLHMMAARQPVAERLLFPEAVQFSARSAALVEVVVPQMEALGFELTPLGDNNFAINATPTGLDGINPSSLLADMMEDAVQKGTTVVDDINHSLALSLARRVAIPYGQPLTREAMLLLAAQLLASDNAAYSPDGKRTHIIIGGEDLARYFV